MNNNVFGGFEMVTQAISHNLGTKVDSSSEEPTKYPHDNIVDPEDIKDNEGEEEIEDKEEIEEEEEEFDIENVDDENGEGESSEEGEDDFTFGDTEPELAKVVHEKLLESLGWEMEADSDNEFSSISDVVDYMKSIIEENSIPEYANEELQKLDSYIREGGDIKRYLQEVHGGINYNSIDISDDKSQKLVVKEHLKTKGYSNDRIERVISRYEDSGTLEEEAEDALEMMKEYQEKTAEKLLEEQKNQHKAILEQQQKYVLDVEKTIESISDIRGIPVSVKEKKKLLEYIFKPTTDGRTQYQKDYLQNNKNLIESAYFTMKGDTLVEKVKRKATSDAARNLKIKLAEKGKRTKDQSTGQNNSSVSAILGLASSQLRKPN